MKVGLIWFRRDLRLDDNPALQAAVAQCDALIPVFIHAPQEERQQALGAASRWWLHHSLDALGRSLREAGSALVLRHGPSEDQIKALIASSGARQIYWNRLYDPLSVSRDKRIKAELRAAGVQVSSFNGHLLHEPWQIQNRAGKPFRVFTPFWRACLGKGDVGDPLPPPRRLPPLPGPIDSATAASLRLLPRIPWDTGLRQAWTPGETAASDRLRAYCRDELLDYGEDRDRPDRPGTSRLSPHLHFGEISPRRVVAAVQRAATANTAAGWLAAAEGFVRQLYWREFGHHLLYHFPDSVQQPMDERYQAFPWRRDYQQELLAWQRGRTGIPMVDAGMRELWHSGWMHNRARMLVASLLTKNLLIPWQQGEHWFRDTLVDADLANNVLGWQWTAGCGVDAAPFFRIFNPATQGRRFDPDGDYVRRWVPELAKLPARIIHAPWEAGPATLAEYGVRLGRDYPQPIVDLKATRIRALEAYASIKR